MVKVHKSNEAPELALRLRLWKFTNSLHFVWERGDKSIIDSNAIYRALGFCNNILSRLVSGSTFVFGTDNVSDITAGSWTLWNSPPGKWSISNRSMVKTKLLNNSWRISCTASCLQVYTVKNGVLRWHQIRVSLNCANLTPYKGVNFLTPLSSVSVTPSPSVTHAPLS